MLTSLHKLGRALANPGILFYSLPYLMLILVLGTIAQKDLGLYHAEKIFFSSWILWLSFVPLPGGLSVLGLIFVNLLAKFIFKSEWSWKKSGIILTHFGVLLLFIGALLTSLTLKETFIIIPEGQESNILQDYYHKGLYIKTGDQTVLSLNAKSITPSQTINIPDTDIQISIISSCKNCRFQKPSEELIPQRKGLAEKIDLISIQPAKEEEANLGGLTFSLSGAGKDIDGVYVTTEAAPHPVTFQYNNVDYELIFKRHETLLPFQIFLENFEKRIHPGTNIAKSYRSDIKIIDQNSEWPATIQMNEPLRYRGYTFFQSSFADTPIGEATILAVVENKGRLFPYISSFIIALGLMFHLAFKMRGLD